MSPPIDKLSHVAALRPARPRPSGGGPPRDKIPDLCLILDAELGSNHLGSHLVVRRSYAGVQEAAASRAALALLLPGAGEREADPRNWVFLDTETTGLAGGTGTYPFLVGLAWWEDSGLVVEQFFMRDFSEEPSLLLALAGRLEGRSVLVTYNGKSFDWPLIETRFRIKRLAIPPQPEVHLDLLHPARRIWRFKLKSRSLSELEREVLGLQRGMDIPSSMIPGIYFDFLHGGPAEPLASVMRHNQMDLCGLAALAARVIRMLEDPHGASCDAAELFGVSRMLRQRGNDRLAGMACEQALAAGLPQDAERLARCELAIMARRQGDFARANDLWSQLVADPHCGLLACEQLAIHYEHRAHDVERAAQLVRTALSGLREGFLAGRIPHHAYAARHAQLRHRLDRLTRKLEVG